MNKKWEVCKENKNDIDKISKENGLSNLISSILASRGIIEKEDVREFLNPTRADFHDPFLMPDMEKAVDRILKAIQTQEKTIIYGDYDVDGITSITVLKKFLEERNLQVGEYIPNRLNEGYGLNKEAVKKIAEQGYKLIITVDCGISCIEEIKYATELGLEVIVTDHHEPAEELPKCLAVVDAKRKDNQYPFNQLAGVGVVFKLIQAISIKLNLDNKEYLKYLDIVCVGTISDIVPLVDENRVITKLGLKLVPISKNIGLRTLLASTGYKEVNSTTISFGIAPRINACGRMGEEKEALKLFLTNDLHEAKEITEKLNNYNLERQETEKRIFKQALEQIENGEELKEKILELSKINKILDLDGTKISLEDEKDLNKTKEEILNLYNKVNNTDKSIDNFEDIFPNSKEIFIKDNKNNSYFKFDLETCSSKIKIDNNVVEKVYEYDEELDLSPLTQLKNEIKLFIEDFKTLNIDKVENITKTWCR